MSLDNALLILGEMLQRVITVRLQTPIPLMAADFRFG